MAALHAPKVLRERIAPWPTRPRLGLRARRFSRRCGLTPQPLELLTQAGFVLCRVSSNRRRCSALMASDLAPNFQRFRRASSKLIFSISASRSAILRFPALPLLALLGNLTALQVMLLEVVRAEHARHRSGPVAARHRHKCRCQRAGAMPGVMLE